MPTRIPLSNQGKGIYQPVNTFLMIKATNKDNANYYLGLEDIKNMEDVFIESISLDPYLRGQVTGWYHHTPEKTCLINDRGLTLSYEGLDVYFRALGIKKAALGSTKTAKRASNKAKKK